MASNFDKLHSHSGLERSLDFSKQQVLIDEQFGELFKVKNPMSHNGKHYYSVHIMDFVKRGGAFKNFNE